jgi:hypothetical protein
VVPRGESFVSSVSSVLGGSFVLPGGLGGRGGLVIVESVDSPSVGGSTAYEVMAGLRDQVISPVSEREGEGRYSMPTGPRRDGVLDPAAESLGATLEAMDIAAADPPRQTRQQTALAQALWAFGGSAPDEATVGGARGKGGASIEAADGRGALKNHIPLGGSFRGGPQEGPANVKLFR